MRENLYRSYSLRGTELALLLASEDKNEIRSFGFVDGSETKEDYLYAVDHMVKQGVALREGDGLVVQEPYKEMIRGIRNAKAVITVRSFDDEYSDYCIYRGESDKVIVLSMSSVRRNCILLTCMDPDDMTDVFLPDGLLPDELPDCEDPDDIDESAFGCILDEFLNRRDITDIRFIVGADEFDTETAEHRTVIVMNLPGGMYTVRYNDDGAVADIYDKEAFALEMTRMFKGEEVL